MIAAATRPGVHERVAELPEQHAIGQVWFAAELRRQRCTVIGHARKVIESGHQRGQCFGHGLIALEVATPEPLVEPVNAIIEVGFVLQYAQVGLPHRLGDLAVHQRPEIDGMYPGIRRTGAQRLFYRLRRDHMARAQR